MTPQHTIVIQLTVVVHLRECAKRVGGIYESLADAASALQVNYFDGNRFGFVPTAKREVGQ